MAILLLRSMPLSEKPRLYFRRGSIKFNVLQHYQQSLSKQSHRCPGEELEGNKGEQTLSAILSSLHWVACTERRDKVTPGCHQHHVARGGQHPHPTEELKPWHGLGTPRCCWVRCSPPQSLFLAESGGWQTQGPPLATPGTSLWLCSWKWRGTSCCGCAACCQRVKNTAQPAEQRKEKVRRHGWEQAPGSSHAAQPRLFQPLPKENLMLPAKGTATSILEPLHFRPANLA